MWQFSFLIATTLVFVVKGQDLELRLAYPCVYCAPARDSIGQWSLWSSWSLCQDNYGVSSQTRTRTCLNGNRCPGGDSQEARQCLGVVRDPTPVMQSTWTTWSSWNDCNGIKQTRTRGCQCQAATNLSDCNCVGDSFEDRPCSVNIPVLEPCTTCQPNPCPQCATGYLLPCYTCTQTPTLAGR